MLNGYNLCKIFQCGLRIVNLQGNIHVIRITSKKLLKINVLYLNLTFYMLYGSFKIDRGLHVSYDTEAVCSFNFFDRGRPVNFVRNTYVKF